MPVKPWGSCSRFAANFIEDISLIYKWLSYIDKIAFVLVGISLLSLMLLGVTDILLTELFHIPIPGALEISESLLVSCVFMPLAWVQSRQRHIGMNFLRMHLGPKMRHVLDLFVGLCSLAFYCLLAWQGWLLAFRSLASREYAAGLLAIPLYPAKIVLAIGISLMVIELIKQLWQTSIHLRQGT
jgi:TRAP-type transport system small permease protein